MADAAMAIAGVAASIKNISKNPPACWETSSVLRAKQKDCQN